MFHKLDCFIEKKESLFGGANLYYKLIQFLLAQIDIALKEMERKLEFDSAWSLLWERKGCMQEIRKM